MQQTTWHHAFTALQQKGVDRLTEEERELRRLPIADVHTFEALFQPRTFEDDASKSGAHLGELLRVLSVRGSLDPITVLKAGGVWWCVDGHHRLDAYRTRSEQQTGRGKRLTHIPVKVLVGTLADAFDFACEANAPDKLNMTQAEKLEAAWQRVLLGVASSSRISQVTTISERTVHNMRRALQQAKMLHSGVAFETWTWSKVKWMLRGEPKEGQDMWQEAKAKEWAKQLARTFCGLPSQHPRVFAQALLHYNAGTAKEIAEAVLSAARLEAAKGEPADF